MAIRLPLSNEVTELWPSQKGLHGTLELSWKPTTLKKRHLLKKKLFYWNSSEHQIYLVLVSKNRLYIWYWWCQNQNSDWTWWGEKVVENKTWFWRGKWKPVRFSGDAKPGTTKPFYKIEIYYQNLEGQSEKRRPAGRSQGRREDRVDERTQHCGDSKGAGIHLPKRHQSLLRNCIRNKAC